MGDRSDQIVQVSIAVLLLYHTKLETTVKPAQRHKIDSSQSICPSAHLVILNSLLPHSQISLITAPQLATQVR
ncbi:hypothetical protein V495_01732 [Pseudogymnoascus sp. VKM F-4514 (FW-929)]|nr:hypothetical protein V490_01113 [Pseudogymnoascus sp. VKM F-3557]KFY47909.1 hypothetical protein V495_01732 [Pseudogymnoascus sp. VKM F-4514 (FW-929)]